LPAGLSLGAGGALSGTATVAGSFSFTITAKDSDSFTASQAYSFTIAVPTIVLAPATLPAPTVGVSYSETVSASGGVAPYSYSISAGALPAGLALSAGGVLSGTATAGGSVSFTVTAKDTDSFTAVHTYSVTVARQASQITVSASSSAVNPAQAVTLVATVSATIAGTPIVPTGTVTFLDNGTAVGTAMLTGGTATLVIASLPAGATAVITASYAGDGNFLPSTSSNGATIVVSAFDFTFTNTGTADDTVAPGAIATYHFAVMPLYGSYPGDVRFNVSGLPMGATASFMPSTIAEGAGETPVIMTVQTASATAENRGRSIPGGIVLSLLLLPFMARRRVRARLRGRMLLLVLLMAGVTATLTACGTDQSVPILHPHTYTLTVTATSGALTHAQVVTLTVQ